MPQMSPILWDSLMIMSFMVLLMLISKIYFYNNKNYTTSSSSQNKNFVCKKMNWVW